MQKCLSFFVSYSIREGVKDFWLNLNENNAGDAILTGYVGKLEDMKSDNTVINLCESGEIVLDFGCGIGRNSIELSKSFKEVYAFDLENMISLVPIKNKLENIKYTSNWEIIKNIKFDVVLASLVFQHIEDSELEIYLSDISKMTKKLVVHSRTWIDDTNSMVADKLNNYFSLDKLEYLTGDHFLGSYNSLIK